MRRTLFAATAAAILGTGCVTAANQDLTEVNSASYTLDPTHTSVTFRVAHGGGLSMYTGRFTAVDGSLTFDPENPAASTLNATIDADSVETDYLAAARVIAERNGEEFDAESAKDFSAEIANKVFKAEDNPTITFASTGIDLTGDNTGTVTGDLTFAGETKPVTLDVTFNGVNNFPWTGERDVIGFSARGTIVRSEFGADTWINYGVGDEVEIIIETEFLEDES